MDILKCYWIQLLILLDENIIFQIMAIHSQSLTVPQCPRGWKDMWIGYSFAMVGPQQFSRCQVLSKGHQFVLSLPSWREKTIFITVSKVSFWIHFKFEEQIFVIRVFPKFDFICFALFWIYLYRDADFCLKFRWHFSSYNSFTANMSSLFSIQSYLIKGLASYGYLFHQHKTGIVC